MNLNLLDRPEIKNSTFTPSKTFESNGRKDFPRSQELGDSVSRHIEDLNSNYDTKMKLIRDKELNANKQLDLQKQSLEQYKMKVENELNALSRETKHNLEKERTINKLRDDFEYMRTQHTAKLGDWENKLSKKEDQLLYQTKDLDLMKQNMLVQQNHFEDIERKMNVELIEKEGHLRQREDDVQ